MPRTARYSLVLVRALLLWAIAMATPRAVLRSLRAAFKIVVAVLEVAEGLFFLFMLVAFLIGVGVALARSCSSHLNAGRSIGVNDHPNDSVTPYPDQ